MVNVIVDLKTISINPRLLYLNHELSQNDLGRFLCGCVTREATRTHFKIHFIIQKVLEQVKMVFLFTALWDCFDTKDILFCFPIVFKELFLQESSD